MVRLPKLYQRFLVYLSIFGLIVFLYYDHNQASRIQNYRTSESFKNVPDADTEEWLRYNGLEGISPGDSLLINIGSEQCFHIGRFYERCFSFYELRPQLNNEHLLVERRKIHKDLRGSFGRKWFGRSEYLYYDILGLRSLDSLGSDLEKLNVEAITGISSRSKVKSVPFKNFFVTFEPITIELLQKRSIISEINVLFGTDCVDPRETWNLQKDVSFTHYASSEPAYLTYRFVGFYPANFKAQRLQETDEGRFKIVQLADLHLGVGESECVDEFPKHETCKADPKTEAFVQQVLDIEAPQLVVFTGDQIMGDRSIQDSETALLKAVAPVISRGIPWAMVWGNHDDEGSLTRWQLSELASTLPYSLFQFGIYDTKDNTFGVGNYVHQVFSKNDTEMPVSTLYFLDSHKYSTVGKIYPGYDWIKESQWEYMKKYYDETLEFKTELSMAFFHIPLPEYLNTESNTHPGEKNAPGGNL